VASAGSYGLRGRAVVRAGGRSWLATHHDERTFLRWAAFSHPTAALDIAPTWQGGRDAGTSSNAASVREVFVPERFATPGEAAAD